jgi:hypothetical protein
VRGRAVLLNLILTVVSMLVFSMFLEIMLRVRFARSMDFSMEMWKYAIALKQPVANPRLSFIHRPNSSAFLMGVPFETNSAGLRDWEHPREKPPGTYRILWLGDSTAVGWGVPLEGSAPKLLEKRLSNSGHGIFEVLNAGVGNYNTVQEVEHYVTMDRSFHPDLVILEYFINDAEPVPRERNVGPMSYAYLPAFATSRFDGLLRLFGVRSGWRDYYSSLYLDGSPGLEAAKSALRRLADITAGDGTGLLILILPELHRINGSYPFEKEQRKIEDSLDSQKTRWIDLISCLRDHGPEAELWITPADAHPNVKANTLIATCVGAAVADERKYVAAKH